jgi:hypothetical protein
VADHQLRRDLGVAEPAAEAHEDLECRDSAAGRLPRRERLAARFDDHVIDVVVAVALFSARRAERDGTP